MPFRPPKAIIPPFPDTLAETLSHIAWQVATAQVSAFAKRAAEQFKARLRGERFESFHEHPLAASTMARKRALGLPLRVMTATGTYTDSIRVFREVGKGGRVLTMTVGHPPGALAMDPRTKRRRPGVTLQQVARWQERGTKHMPARPHWAPMLEDLRKQAPAVRDHLRRLVVAEWRRRMGM